MKYQIFVIVPILSILTVENKIQIDNGVLLEKEWTMFKLNHDKKYATLEEEELRKKIFSENFVTVADHNRLYVKGEESYSMGINQFSDLSETEMVGDINLGYEDIEWADKVQEINFHDIASEVPDRIDWRKLGAVTPIKWQTNCTASWAFAAVGTLESQYFIKTGKLVRLSEQNLIDCSTITGNNGCSKGDPINAYEYIYLNDGIDSETSYPFKAKTQQCAFDASNNVTTIRYFGRTKEGSEEFLKVAVATVGPVASIIYADIKFRSYQSGVFYNAGCERSDLKRKLNHALVIVGYGTTNDGREYWIAKNSWNKYWGENGYIRLARNRNNNCGVATYPNFPILY